MSKTYFYVYKLKKDDKGFIGFGITQNADKRHKQHLQTFKKAGVFCDSYVYKVFSSYEEASSLEYKIKRCFADSVGLKIEGFRSESIPIENFAEFRSLVERFNFEIDKIEEKHRMVKHRIKREFGIDRVDKDVERAVYILRHDKKLAFQIIMNHIANPVELSVVKLAPVNDSRNSPKPHKTKEKPKVLDKEAERAIMLSLFGTSN